jgi:protein-L-isoaspartate(D-aspartate) O-methyltransferase
MTIDEYLRAYTEKLRNAGAVRTPAVEHAFRTVRRDRCVTRVFLSRTDQINVPQDQLPSPDVLNLIYNDNALVTRLPGPDFTTVSSSSLPSLMAHMLEALEPQPGHRVQEIGAGTGYNAALIATITNAPVVSIDVQDNVVTDAQAALRRLGMKDVTVHCADGYNGYPTTAQYQRIIVTVACTGISPLWIDQLDHDGLIIAPIAHGGAHPILAVRSHNGTLTGRPVLWTDFMRARGPLYHWPDPNRPQVFEPLTVSEFTEHDGIIPHSTKPNTQTCASSWLFATPGSPKLPRSTSTPTRPWANAPFSIRNAEPPLSRWTRLPWLVSRACSTTSSSYTTTGSTPDALASSTGNASSPPSAIPPSPSWSPHIGAVIPTWTDQ